MSNIIEVTYLLYRNPFSLSLWWQRFWKMKRKRVLHQLHNYCAETPFIAVDEQSLVAWKGWRPLSFAVLTWYTRTPRANNQAFDEHLPEKIGGDDDLLNWDSQMCFKGMFGYAVEEFHPCDSIYNFFNLKLHIIIL